MNQLLEGQFYGQTTKTTSLDGLVLTDTVYTHTRVDWHFHEHAYFTFILQGSVIEGNKKELYNLTPGSLLFHNWQESHYNIKPDGFTRGFHLEINRSWWDDLALPFNNLEGSINISNLDIKMLMYKVFRSTKMGDDTASLSIQTLLLEMLSKMNTISETRLLKVPKWVTTIDELLRDQLLDTHNLNHLSKILNIHPVHLSRDFPKYFNCNLGEYVRKLRVDKALSLMTHNKSFTDIAYYCGFSDQSHFTRCFREFNQMTPSDHRKVIFKK